MPIPSQKDIQIPLLHLIYDLGGKVKPQEIFVKLAEYFHLTKEEREEILSSGFSKRFDNRVHWARYNLYRQGFLDSSVRNLWEITEKGKKELARLGLIDKHFPRTVSVSTEDEEYLKLALEKITPEGIKKFPDDFLDNTCSMFYEVEIPGIPLHLAPLSNTIIISSKGYFRYQAKNPSEAKYILYAYNLSLKKVKIPSNNFTLFKTVKAYEKYCDEIISHSFDIFLEFTNDENKAEYLSEEFRKKFDLRASRNRKKE